MALSRPAARPDWVLAALLVPTLAPPAAAAGRHALLVGCTRYDNVPAYRLDGADNDIPLLTGVLKDLYGFTDADIRVLSEQATRLKDLKWRPTRDNIAREFRELAGRARRDDQVMIWLAGHGGSQPDHPPPGVPKKPGGLRQTFYPCDVSEWDDRTRSIPRAIRDFELRQWLKDITNRGAYVWVVVDACHSGTIGRNGPRERVKEIPAAVLKIPDLPPADRGPRREAVGLELAAGNDRLAAVYACEAEDVTVEARLPHFNDTDPWHGLLTYHLCCELRQAQSRLTYTELVNNIRARYEAAGRREPRPLAEFTGRDRLVLGCERIQRGPFRLNGTPPDGPWTVDGGMFHGLTEGSVLGVRPPAGQGDDPIGWVKVTAVRPFASDVEPCTPEGKPALGPNRLCARCRCKPVFIDFGPLQLSVAVVTATEPLVLGDAGRKARWAELTADLDRRVSADRVLAAELRKSAGQGTAAFDLVEDPWRAQWLLLCLGGKSTLLVRGGGLATDLAGPAAAVRLVRGAAGPPVWLPDDPDRRPRFPLSADENPAPALQRQLTRIARADLLCRVVERSATTPAPAKADPEVRPLVIEVKFVRAGGGKDGKDVEVDPARDQFRRGDRLSCEVINRSESVTARAAITVLHVDSDFRITALYPRRGELNGLLLKGQSVEEIAVPVGAGKQPGAEHLLVIAVRSVNDVPDFTWLAEADLEGARGASTFGSPLGRLFRHALFRDGSERGPRVQSLGDYLLLVRSWEPTRRP
jgi:hypothetical protein